MEFLNVLILVGAIQGFISSGLFLLSRHHGIPSKLLGYLLFCISLACLNIYIMESGWKYEFEAVRVIGLMLPMILVMPMGPLLFFYIRSSLDPDFILSRKRKFHFMTAAADLIPYLLGSIVVLDGILNFLTDSQSNKLEIFIGSAQTYLDIPRWISVTLYIVLSFSYVRKSRQVRELALVKRILYAFAGFQVLWLMHLIPYIIPTTQETLLEIVKWYPVYIPLAALVYWIGINGYLSHRSNVQLKSRTSALDPDMIRSTLLNLKHAMENDNLFLEQNLSLDQVVKHTGLPQKQISAVLNQHLHKTFNEFVNTYRVEELKKRLTEEGNGHLTITGLAMECGFSSQATLQRTFKQMTKLSPREFQQLARSKTQEKSANSAQL